jgi:F-type H+-transporting ATPase subunit b
MSLAVNVANAKTLVGGVDVDFDATIAVQVVFFLFLLVVLKPLLFDPMLKLFEEREKRIDGARKQARQIDEASAEALEKYEKAMAKARAEANAERDKLRGEGMRTEAEILGKVRAATTKMLEEGRGRMRTEVDATRTQLRQEVSVLARDLAGRVLGREVQ